MSQADTAPETDDAFILKWESFYSRVDDVAITLGLQPLAGNREMVRCFMPLTKAITQPAGMYSAPALFGLADISATFLAMEQVPEGGGFPLCVQSSLNVVSNSRSPRAVSTSTVIKTGRTLTVTDTKIHDNEGKLLAVVVATFVIS